ncbi:RpiB/LacA/LacB family sugar-phosphate isomerase [Blattabacterium cuenoti]|uniref:RpiB/LacA/LacB family sugar-phosphate isomerase n=1 Tax=Blattabacterium cuenoti TaxID=1653831 RepID=UPI00163CC65F|nr:RpiB/LacA/LacB family sugar-phosphate isomerase [Blattabacterium cuenoti]
MKIAIGSDHTGVYYKSLIKDFLIKMGYEIKDFGTFSKGKVDYPDYVHPTVEFVNEEKANLGIIICGSGNGAAMTANKYKRIRAALVWRKEVAFLAKEHNNANVISLPARFLEENEVLEIIKIFLRTKFKGGRHQKRINKIPIKVNKINDPQ